MEQESGPDFLDPCTAGSLTCMLAPLSSVSSTLLLSLCTSECLNQPSKLPQLNVWLLKSFNLLIDAVFSLGLDASLQWFLDLSPMVVVNRSFPLQQPFVYLATSQQWPRHVYPCRLSLSISYLIFIVLLSPSPTVSTFFLNCAECFCCGLAAAEVRSFPPIWVLSLCIPWSCICLFCSCILTYLELVGHHLILLIMVFFWILQDFRRVLCILLPRLSVIAQDNAGIGKTFLGVFLIIWQFGWKMKLKDFE